MGHERTEVVAPPFAALPHGAILHMIGDQLPIAAAESVHEFNKSEIFGAREFDLSDRWLLVWSFRHHSEITKFYPQKIEGYPVDFRLTAGRRRTRAEVFKYKTIDPMIETWT
jgi:hypothetical protein